ncbi:LysR family transcriptional regulator [Blautia sp. XA-2221]|uniref:LysR family transcriptional regulator n=1 Tax=Blautia sp. XA-2221 TaxID=2903961 RepID=UPI002377FA54|nr:LysR family transcriptional regulator [Blautia sp. XA-2221]
MDLKQLQYFVACAQTGSVSEAAKILYSTQPSVSKVVKALEDSLGMQLFERLPRGIRLTPQGSQVYHYACKIVSEVTKLEAVAEHGMTKWLRISANPSSWFATQFVDFYNENYDKNYHFQVYTAGVRTVMERVRDYQDDVGFVYILERQKEEFLYELSRNRMEFIPLQDTEAIVYPGRNSSLYGIKKDSLSFEELDGVRLVQNYQDEFFDIGASGNSESFSLKSLDASVITNSDYIMERLLKNSDVVNISGSYLSENKKDTIPGIPLKMKGSRVIFGYIRHRGEEPDSSLREFIHFLEERIGSDK